jgi:putative membrane protein insertion efficiency factor
LLVAYRPSLLARPRRVLVACAVALLVLTAVDLSRPPARQWSAYVAIGAIHVYQRRVSPWLPAIGVGCRFEPSCSRYAEEVIRRHGALVGGWLAFRRILRCGPWTPMGTVDRPE